MGTFVSELLGVRGWISPSANGGLKPLRSHSAPMRLLRG